MNNLKEKLALHYKWIIMNVGNDTVSNDNFKDALKTYNEASKILEERH